MGVIPALVMIIDEMIHHQERLAEQLTQAKNHCEYLKEKKLEHLEQERCIEAYLTKEAYRLACQAKTLSTVEV